MKTLIDIIEEHAINNPSKKAIFSNNLDLTYSELDIQMSKFARGLNNFPKNSIVSLLFDNSINFIISYLGTVKAGHVAHIISPNISYDDLLFQIKSAKSKLLVIENEFFEKITNYKLPLEIKKFEEIGSTFTGKTDYQYGEIAHLLFTSGTTSEPKGIPITHSNMIFTLENIISILKYDSSDVVLLPLPLHHSFGLGCMNTTLYSGGTLILLNNASDLPMVLESIKKYNVTTFSAVPTTLIKLIKFHKNEVKELFNNLRLVLTNSTSIPPQTVFEYKSILDKGHLSTYYGLSEASRSTFMIFEKFLDKDSSVGKPAPHVDIEIRNKKENVGEIWIRGPNVINQYWNNPMADKNLINGWLKTGDLGYFDEDGFLFLSGRLDDVINVGGEKVFPEYVENVIRRLKGIEQVVIVGQKHEVFGQTVKAFVKLNHDATLKKSDILSFCIRNLEKFMVPTKIEFIDEIPVTEYGKIKRFLFRLEDE